LIDTCIAVDKLLDLWENDGNGLALLQATLLILELPSRVIVPGSTLKANTGSYTMKIDDLGLQKFDDINIDIGDTRAANRPPRGNEANREGPRDAAIGGSKKARTAANKIKQGKPKSAKNLLFSNGVAPANQETGDIMAEMHLNYGEPINKIDIEDVDQIKASPELFAEKIRAQARTKSENVDAYGWAQDFMHTVTRLTGDKNSALVIGRLQSILLSDDIPEAIACVFSTGALTALNKVPSTDNDERRATGLKPKLRPVNGSAWILKGVFRLPDPTVAHASKLT
jgi:hypothetical protein